MLDAPLESLRVIPACSLDEILRHHLYPLDDTLYLVCSHRFIHEVQISFTFAQTFPVLNSLLPVYGCEAPCGFQAVLGLHSAGF